MIHLKIEDGLLLCSIRMKHNGEILHLERVLVDTGSGGTIISSDKAASVNIVPEANDNIYRVRGVGGSEFVYAKIVDEIELGFLKAKGFETEFGAMNYGFDLDGIIRLDFLLEIGAIIDLEAKQIYQKEK